MNANSTPEHNTIAVKDHGIAKSSTNIEDAMIGPSIRDPDLKLSFNPNISPLLSSGISCDNNP